MGIGHTPGPWNVWKTFHIANNYADVAEVEDICVVESGNVADAALIAAAPELLEVCQNLADELEAEIKARYRETPLLYPTMRARYDQDMSTINQARSVIALAKGQTE